jgi:hypothetical protein
MLKGTTLEAFQIEANREPVQSVLTRFEQRSRKALELAVSEKISDFPLDSGTPGLHTFDDNLATLSADRARGDAPAVIGRRT